MNATSACFGPLLAPPLARVGGHMTHRGARTLSSRSGSISPRFLRLHGADWKPDPSWSAVLSHSERIEALGALAAFLRTHNSVVAITGAGCSTASGIPDYRGPKGSYRHGHRPVTHLEFVQDEHSRKRYWSRSMVAWSKFNAVAPNRAHHALSALETMGKLSHTITQNVDGLHQRAGSVKVTDLHGRMDCVRCLGCGTVSAREEMQQRLEMHNEEWRKGVGTGEQRADGDAELGEVDYEAFYVPGCTKCGGVLKTDVVFFGDNVPRDTVDQCFEYVRNADALLVVGSSLEVYSAFRFIDREVVKAEEPKPLAIVNVGTTRAERAGAEHLKVNLACDEALWYAVSALQGEA